jgi:transposase
MMDRYLGLDGHAVSCTLAVVGPSGKRLKSMVVETNGAALVEAVRSIPGQRHLCLEEGELSAWLCELLTPHVVELVVTVPKARRGSKDDERDAWSRAEELRIGAIETRVYKAPAHLAALKNAARAYRMAVQDTTRVKNRLKAVLRARGVLADSGVYHPERRSGWLKQLPQVHRRLAEWLGEELDRLEPLREQAEQWLLSEAKTHPIIRILSTAPGMGPIRTALLVAVVVNPSRFRTRRPFWSYSGLGIVTRSSSDWVREKKSGRWVRAEAHQTLGLSRKRQPLLKAIFKGAATTVIAQMPDDPLCRDYQRRLQAGIKPNLAKLTLARQTAAMVLSMWKHQEVYEPQRHADVIKRAG